MIHKTRRTLRKAGEPAKEPGKNCQTITLEKGEQFMAFNDVSLTAGMRSNLVALQGTVDLLNRTQERLSTGKKVNTALDNPLSYFTAKSLNSRAADLAGYKDGMSEAVQTIKAANTGISAIEGLLAQAKAVAASAKAGAQGGSGAVTQITVDLTTVSDLQQITVGTKTFTAAASEHYAQKTLGFTASMTQGETITIGATTYTAVSTTTGITATQFLVTGVATSDAASFAAKIGTAGTLASTTITLDYITSMQTVSDVATHNDITSANVALSAYEFYIGGTNAADATALAAKLDAQSEVNASANGAKITITSGTVTITGNTVTSAATSMVASNFQSTTDRISYSSQFNDIMDQLDLLATDSGYKGINFLAAGNTLDVEFGSSSTDKITLTGFDASAAALLAKTDGTKVAQNFWETNDDVDVDIAGLVAATATLKTETSRLSSGLSIINTRQDWVKGMVNTVTEGADKLTLADMNEEGANMLMLQTRQTLGTTALSLSAQAAQSVLRLFA
jgi:flagellin